MGGRIEELSKRGEGKKGRKEKEEGFDGRKIRRKKWMAEGKKEQSMREGNEEGRKTGGMA